MIDVAIQAIGDPHKNCIAAICGSVLTLVVCTLYAVTYQRYSSLHCAFNRILFRLNVAQMGIAANVFVSSALYLGGNLSPTMCTISAAVDNFVGNIALMMNAAFFVAIGILKRNGQVHVPRWSVFVALVATIMVIIYLTVVISHAQADAAREKLYFTMELAWCSAPTNSSGITTLTPAGLGFIHLFLCFILGFILIVTAITSFVFIRLIDGKTSDWSHGKDVVYVRFFGSIIFSFVVFTIGGFARFRGASTAVGIIASFSYPLWGAFNAMVFFISERLTLAHVIPSDDAPPLPEDGFAAVTAALACAPAAGCTIPSFISEPDRLLQGEADYYGDDWRSMDKRSAGGGSVSPFPTGSYPGGVRGSLGARSSAGPPMSGSVSPGKGRRGGGKAMSDANDILFASSERSM